MGVSPHIYTPLFQNFRFSNFSNFQNSKFSFFFKFLSQEQFFAISSGFRYFMQSFAFWLVFRVAVVSYGLEYGNFAFFLESRRVNLFGLSVYTIFEHYPLYFGVKMRNRGIGDFKIKNMNMEKTETHYKELLLEFSKKLDGIQWHLKQLYRHGDFCIYKLFKDNSNIVAYEVIKARKAKEATRLINGVEIKYDASEYYPKGNSFGGSSDWHCNNLNSAIQYFNEELSKRKIHFILSNDMIIDEA